jgi:hypothetical protein
MLDSRLGTTMDRNLARKNIRTGLILGIVVALIFGATFVGGYIYTS